MNETFSDLIERIQENLISIMAIFMIVVILIGYLLFTTKSILPQWRSRSDLITRVAVAEEEIAQSSRVQQTSVGTLKRQIDDAPDELSNAANFLITEAQANQFLSNLYQYANSNEVEIAELLTQSKPSSDSETLYNVKQFQLRVSGELEQLVAFLARLKEVSQPSYILTNVKISEGTIQDSLTMNIVLYTSPLAPGVTVATNLNDAINITPPSVQEPLPVRYTIQRGDTLLSISRQFNISIAAIRQANSFGESGLSTNQELLIPR